MTANRNFLFKLASHLHKSVGEIENTISYNELKEWAIFFREEPSLPDRMEIQLAVLTSIVYNVNSKEPLSYSDFMLSMSEDDKQLIQQKELEHKIKSFFKGN